MPITFNIGSLVDVVDSALATKAEFNASQGGWFSWRWVHPGSPWSHQPGMLKEV